MGVLIDTSVLINIEHKQGDVSSLVQGREEEEFFLSVISASELLHGVCRAKDPAVRSERLAYVEAIFASMPVMQIDLPTARCHAQLWAELAKQGQMIGVHDSWLAATCLAHGLVLLTANQREFRRVPGLRVEGWM